MNRFLRLLCLATLATAAFAQTSSQDRNSATAAPASELSAPVQVTSPAPADAVVTQPDASEKHPDLQPRSRSRETVLPIATVLRLKLDRSISTARDRAGEPFTATLTQPVDVDGHTVIPAGSPVNCRVERARGARRFSGKPSLSIKALGVRMPSGEELNFTASVVDTSNPRHLDVDQEGSVRGASPNPMNKVELGSLTAVGAVAGVVVAGPEGLLIGAAGGAAVAAGHIVVKHRDLTLPAGTELVFELDAPATLSRPQMGGMQ
jgi:hypothetical protein